MTPQEYILLGEYTLHYTAESQYPTIRMERNQLIHQKPAWLCILFPCSELEVFKKLSFPHHNLAPIFTNDLG